MTRPRTARDWGELAPGTFRRYLDDAPPDIKPKLLKLRFRHNIFEFAKFCWPERFNLPFNELHRDLAQLHDVPPWYERGKPDILQARAAPRGYAKSTFASYLQILHDIAYGIEAYILLMSSGQRLARAFSTNLLAQFKSTQIHDDRRFTRLYGPFKVTGGKDEWQVSVDGAPSVGVLTASFTQDVRGAQHPERGIRPTKVVMDDSEKKELVKNPMQRDKWEQKLQKDILKLGPRDRGAVYQIVGTILHIDSMLARRENDPGWDYRKFKAIIEWPKNRRRWEECRRIWTNLALEDRRQQAYNFYLEHQEEMDAGVELLDPEVASIFELYEVIWGQGLPAFLQEMQNDPIDPNTQIFFSDRFAYFDFKRDSETGETYLDVQGMHPRKVWLRDIRTKFVRWDPAKGNPGGDYACIALLGRDAHGFKYVLGCWLQKKPPSVQLASLWAICEHWDCEHGSLESNGFQELCAEPYRRQRNARKESGRWFRLKLESDPSSGNKEDRISTLEPEVTNHWLSFHRGLPAVLFRQFDAFPNGDHDDGPDAVQGASAALGSVNSVGMAGGA